MIEVSHESVGVLGGSVLTLCFVAKHLVMHINANHITDMLEQLTDL